MTNITYVDFKRKMRMGECVQKGECKLKYNATLYSDDYDLCFAFHSPKTRAVGILNSDDESELEKFIDLAKSTGISRIEVLTKSSENSNLASLETLLNNKGMDYEMTFQGSGYFVVEPNSIKLCGNYLLLQSQQKSTNRTPHISNFNRFHSIY